MIVQKNKSCRVVISKPNINDMKLFLLSVKKSRHLHTPWVSPPSNEKEFKAYLDKISQDNQYGCLLRLKGADDIIGVININEIVRGCFQSGYLGFYGFDGYQGQGLVAEGLLLVIQHAFLSLGLHRLEANIQPDNIKSIALVKRHNFRHEGFSLNYLCINDKWRDHERFALTLEDVQPILIGNTK